MVDLASEATCLLAGGYTGKRKTNMASDGLSGRLLGFVKPNPEKEFELWRSWNQGTLVRMTPWFHKI